MRPHQRFLVEDPSQVGEARRAGQVLAQDCGLDDTAAGQVALAITELGTNLVRHAGGGQLLLSSPATGRVEVLSLDAGPGMDVRRCLQDGYSTAGSAGTGLGAVQRIAERFDAFSLPRQGTVIAMTVASSALARAERAAPPQIDLAAVALAAPGEIVSGDGWGWRVHDDQVWLMCADGLGHGVEAAEAADTVLASFERSCLTSPAAMLEEAHERMRATRGAAVSVAALDVGGARLTFAGAGNVSGRLVSGITDRTLMSQHGTLGVQIRKLKDLLYEWPEHAIVVLHSDGIISRWNFDAVPGLLQTSPAVIAGWIMRDHCRGRDDATVVVARRATNR